MNSRKEKDHDKKQKNRTLNHGESSDTEEDK